jgi:hypothetical protein
VRLSLDWSSQQTELGKKEQVKEAVLGATVLEGGALLLAISGAAQETLARYKKGEKRAARSFAVLPGGT